MKISSTNTNLRSGSFQSELPGVGTALEDSLGLLPDQFHHHDPLQVLLNAQLAKPPVIPPGLQLTLNQSSVNDTLLDC